MIRHNPITGEPVILATKRAARPNAFGDDAEIECPFCPGNESMTPPEISRVGDPWLIRVVPNKYPATEMHEVIVESPSHDATFDAVPPEDAVAVVEMYAERYRTMLDPSPGHRPPSPRKRGEGARLVPPRPAERGEGPRSGGEGRVRHVTIFKNHGPRAGASLPHLHSQILGVPFVPPRVQREIDGFTRAAACPLCAPDGEVIASKGDFVWIAPRAAIVPYQQWIVPRKHAPEMAASRDLAELLQQAARATDAVAPAFNWIFMNFPGAERAHWYVDVVPRIAALAGFEIGSGSGINVIDAEASARSLRDHAEV